MPGSATAEPSVYDEWTCQAEVYALKALGRSQVPPVWQVVYPDKARHWPWEAGTSSTFRQHQPLLGMGGGGRPAA